MRIDPPNKQELLHTLQLLHASDEAYIHPPLAEVASRCTNWVCELSGYNEDLVLNLIDRALKLDLRPKDLAERLLRITNKYMH